MNQVAILSGSTYQLLEIIPGLDEASYVLRENENGEHFICPLDRWEAAAPAPATKVHAKSSSQDKIALFRELFHGREDVYAKRWYNRAVPEGETLLIIATGKYIGEGFDEPRLDTLFLAMPFSWKGTLAQYVGRLHRNYE